ncbi:hypothetical protein [Gimesia fumaroli]|uniref:hypothetical protein n=1 Tax=Gimesia fumaroli TaxID=2527976 RepID=UPI0018D7373A|nr:hypothetical protein [Gimesia fumaroli]
MSDRVRPWSYHAAPIYLRASARIATPQILQSLKALIQKSNAVSNCRAEQDWVWSR